MRDGKARVLDKVETDRLFAVVSATRHAARNTAVAFLSYGCGMRVGEIATLLVGDVLNADGTIKAECTLKAINTKTSKPRQFYLTNPKVAAALQAYIEHRLANGDVELDGPLFVTQKRTQFTPNTLQAALAVIYRKAGLTGCKSHSGRRTFATRLITAGHDIKSVSKLMGHSTIKQTAEYVETSPDALRKIAAKAI